MAALCRHLFALPVHHVGRAMARSTTRDSSGHVTWRSVSCLPFCSSSPLLATIGVPAMFGAAAAAAAAAHRSPAQQAAALMGGPGSGSGRGRGSGDGGGDGASKPPKITLASLAAVVEAQRGEIAALRARVATLEGVAALYTGEAGAGGGGAGLGSPAASAAATYGRREASGSSPPPPALPAGWEGRLDTVTGRTFYIDHNTRTTSWSLPGVPPPQLAAPQPAAAAVVAAGSEFVAGAERNGWAGVAGGGEGGGVGWGKSDRVGGVSNSSLSRSNSSGAGIGKTGAPFRLLQLGVDEVRGKIIPGVLNAMMEVFLANGDLHAAVYTASRAIHTVGGHHSSTSKLAVSGLHRIR